MKDNEYKSTPVSPKIGIYVHSIYEDTNIFESVAIGSTVTARTIKKMFIMIFGLITGSVSTNAIGGPIAIATVAGEVWQQGLLNFFNLMAMLSISLGVMNILPIPGLDGGHVFITLIEGAIGRELSIETKMKIQQVGVTMILLLFIFIMYSDIVRIFS